MLPVETTLFVFEAIRAFRFEDLRGDIALDNVMVYPQLCDDIDCKKTPPPPCLFNNRIRFCKSPCGGLDGKCSKVVGGGLQEEVGFLLTCAILYYF